MNKPLHNIISVLIALLTLVVLQVFFIAFSAYSWYFPKFQMPFTGAVLILTFLLARSVYEFVPQTRTVKNISSFVLAFFACQLFWVFTFLPFHYSVAGLMLFNIFYF